MQRLLALVGIGALVLLAGFPFVSRWRLEHRLARVFELNARLTARVVPRPVPDGSVDEAFACAYAVLKPLAKEVPALHRDWDATGVDPLQPWFDGEVLTPSPEVAEALGELEPAMTLLRTCATAREFARGSADLTAQNRKLLRIGRATHLVVARALLEGHPSDAARICVETLAVYGYAGRVEMLSALSQDAGLAQIAKEVEDKTTRMVDEAK